MTDRDAIARHDDEIEYVGCYGFPADFPSLSRAEVKKSGIVNVGSAAECLMRACRRLIDNDRHDAMDDISLALAYLGQDELAEKVSEMSLRASEQMDDLSRQVAAIEGRVNEIWNILQATRKRLDDVEAKGGNRQRKPVDTINAKPINLRNMESEVVDGEMFSFTGKYFWSENKGKFTKIAFSPLDAGRDEKCGKFFTTFEALPDWLQKGQAVEVVAQCKAKPPYMNYNVVSMKPMGAANAPQYDDPAMLAQAPLDISGEPVTRTGEYIDRGGIRQTFVSDEEAGVDPSTIPF